VSTDTNHHVALHVTLDSGLNRCNQSCKPPLAASPPPPPKPPRPSLSPTLHPPGSAVLSTSATHTTLPAHGPDGLAAVCPDLTRSTVCLVYNGMQHHTSSCQLRWGKRFSSCSPTSTAATAAAAHHSTHCRHSPANVCVWAGTNPQKLSPPCNKHPSKLLPSADCCHQDCGKGSNRAYIQADGRGLWLSVWRQQQTTASAWATATTTISSTSRHNSSVCCTRCNRALLHVHASDATSRATCGSARQTNGISCTGERGIWSKAQLTTHTTPHA